MAERHAVGTDRHGHPRAAKNDASCLLQWSTAVTRNTQCSVGCFVALAGRRRHPPPPKHPPGTDQAVRGGCHGQKLHSGFPPPRQGDARGSADARSSADACLSWQKVQRREANGRRHGLTEPTTKALCHPPPPQREVLQWPYTIGGAPPPPQTKGTIVEDDEIYRRKNLVDHFWYTDFWVDRRMLVGMPLFRPRFSAPTSEDGC